MRGALVILALALVLGSPAHGQGVPTQDNMRNGQLVALLSRLGEDTEAQNDQRATGISLAAVQADQLR
ncbi:MAG: lytic transglycosylase domain-containing protein, partial [Pseudomonadota bacterium]